MASRPTDEIARWADWQLQNWANWTRYQVGCGVTQVDFELEDDRPVPVEDEAVATEAALVELKQSRERLYRAVWLRYRQGLGDHIACVEMKVSAPTYRQLVSRAYAWLDGHRSGWGRREAS